MTLHAEINQLIGIFSKIMTIKFLMQRRNPCFDLSIDFDKSQFVDRDHDGDAKPLLTEK